MSTAAPHAAPADAHVVVPARIFFLVCAYRCLFPVRYEHQVVFHDSPFSSIFTTRLLATLSEVTYVYQFSYVLRALNAGHVGWVNALSWVMVLQVAVSQALVWGAILTERLELYFYEELGWANIFAINTVASGYLCVTGDGRVGARVLLQLSLLFGAAYLPWQVFHLKSLWAQAGAAVDGKRARRTALTEGLRRSLRTRNRRRDARSWGGLIGLTWMAGYWALLLPPWIHEVVEIASRHGL